MCPSRVVVAAVSRWLATREPCHLFTSPFPGGTTVVIYGRGFNPNPAFVRVLFGNVPCIPTGSSPTAVTCRMGSAIGNATVGGVAAVPVNPLTLRLSISPSEDAPFQTFTSNTTSYTFVPSMTPNVVFATRTRGSTEGGTRIEFTVTNMVGVEGVVREMLTAVLLHGLPSAARTAP